MNEQERSAAAHAPTGVGVGVGIVGAGPAGMAAAYAIFQQGLADTLVLADKDARRAAAEALDLMHAPGDAGPCTVLAGTYADLAGATCVIVTTAASERTGESRLELLERSVAVMRDVAIGLDRHAPDAVVLVASDPVDLLTWALQELSERPHERIIGTGTLLDTMRLRALLAQHYAVDPRSVAVQIIGEHGDSEVPVWSAAHIAGTRLADAPVLGRAHDVAALQALFAGIRSAAADVVAGKGYTNWGAGLASAQLLRTVRDDLRTVLPVSVRLDGEYGLSGLCLSVPTVVGGSGAGGRLPPPLDLPEQEALRRSANVVSTQLAQLRMSVIRRRA